MTKYTDADVEKLVRDVEFFIASGNCPHRWKLQFQLTLKSFLINPEEELIEKMARAINGSVQRYYAWDQLCEEGRNRWREDARAALAVVKREGLPT